MDIKIKIFQYALDTIKNGKLQKLVFISYEKVKDLVKDSQYDILKLELEQKVELCPDESPIYREHGKVIKRATRVESYIAILKYAQ